MKRMVGGRKGEGGREGGREGGKEEHTTISRFVPPQSLQISISYP